MALTAWQYADLTEKIKKKKEDAVKLYGEGEDWADARSKTEGWYDNLIAFLNPERKDDGAYFTSDPSFMDAYTAEHWEEYEVLSEDNMNETYNKYHAAFESGDVYETLKAIQSMLGLEPAEPVKQKEPPKTDLDIYGFATTSEESRKTILMHLLGNEADSAISNRPFDPMNREDVLRLFRRNENGEYEPAFPEASDPKFKGLTEQQTLDVLAPENGFLYYKAGSEYPYVFSKKNAIVVWSKSQWNPDPKNKNSAPVFANGQNPRLGMSKEALKEERRRKELDVMLKEEKRAEEVYRFLFGSKLNHTGSDTYQTYDEKWVANIRERGGIEYPVPSGKTLPEDDVVALTLLNLADPDVTGKMLDGLENPFKDNRATTYSNFEMSLDTYLNRETTNTSSRFIDPIVTARDRTNSILTEYYRTEGDAPERYEQMGAALARALPMLTSPSAFPRDLNGAIISRCGAIKKVQNLIEAHPQILSTARQKAKELGTLDVFERSLRQCQTLSKLSDFGKKAAENELRFARHQAGNLYDAEGQKINLSPKEAETLRIETAKRSVVGKMLLKCAEQLCILPPEQLMELDEKANELRETGLWEYSPNPIPEEKRSLILDSFSVPFFTNIDAQKKEMAPVLTLILEHEGGMAVFDDILKKAKDPQNEKEITKALIDNKLIPAGTFGDLSFDYDGAIEAYRARHLGYQTFVDGIRGNGTSPLNPEYQKNHQHGSFYGGFVVSDDIKKQLQEQPISEFLHFEQGERAGEHYVTHKIPEMGRHEPKPNEKGDAINYKLREYMNKATKYAFRINFKENGDLKNIDEVFEDRQNINSSDMIKKCQIPSNEKDAFTAFYNDHIGSIKGLTIGINMQLQKIAYYDAMAKHLPQMKDDDNAKTVKKFLEDSYDDYRMVKHKISRVVLQPEDNDTFLNFCPCDDTGGILRNMADCVNRYRKSKNLDELHITAVKADFPKVEAGQPNTTQTFPWHVMSAVDVKLNGQQCTLTMESTAPPFGKLLYQPDKNPQALGLYHSVDEIRQVYSEKENCTKQYSSKEEIEIIDHLGGMTYKKDELGLDKPYNFSNFAKDPVFGAIKGREPQPQEAENTVEQQIHKLQEFSKRIADSQKAIWGSSSTEFKDLQRKVDECLAFMQQEKENNPLYLGADEKKTAERLAGLGKYARAYLGIKQDEDGTKKNLNARGKVRYDLASKLKNFAEQFEPKQPTIAGVTPASHAEGRKMLDRFCEQMKNTEEALKGQPSLEQAKFNDFSAAVKGLREIENTNATKKLDPKIPQKLVRIILKRAENYIDAEKIAAEKAGKELSAEAKIRIDIAEKLSSFANGFNNVLPDKEVQNTKNKAVANDLMISKIDPVL